MAGQVLNPNYEPPIAVEVSADSPAVVGPGADAAPVVDVGAAVAGAVRDVVEGLASDVAGISIHELTIAVREQLAGDVAPDAYDGNTVEQAAAALGFEVV